MQDATKTKHMTDLLDKSIAKKSLKIPKGGNQNPYIEEEQTTQWPKEKVQKDKQRSTKHTYKTIDRVTRTPLKTRGELRCSGSVSSSCPTNQNALDRYEKLFNTAYTVSKNDPLFSDYTFISAIKIKIYLHLGSNHLDTDVCVNYIKTIPEVFRNDVIDHLKQAQFISIMPDSSTDQEAILLRYVHPDIHEPATVFAIIRYLFK